MEEAGGQATRMLPLWVQWLFAGGGLVLLVAVFLALWVRLGKMDKRLARIESRLDNPAGTEQEPPPQ